MTKQKIHSEPQAKPCESKFQRPQRRPQWLCCLLMLLALLFSLGANAGLAAGTRSKMLRIFTEETNGVTHFFAQNLEAADVTATFDLKLANLKCSTNLPCTFTFPGYQTIEAFTVRPSEMDLPWSYRFTDSFTIGSATAHHDDTYVYSLPYAAGQAFCVSQGYGGSFSHTGPDKYSIDWRMPIGTHVHAARAGVVVKATDNSDIGGPDRKFVNCANCVLIRHSDGTIGIYAHLLKGGNRVKVGDRMEVGDWIALSGNTGFTSGPHLHFSVFKTTSGRRRESIPVRFRAADGEALTLLAGENYQCAPAATQQAKVKQPKVRLPLATVVAGRKKG